MCIEFQAFGELNGEQVCLNREFNIEVDADYEDTVQDCVDKFCSFFVEKIKGNRWVRTSGTIIIVWDDRREMGTVFKGTDVENMTKYIFNKAYPAKPC